MPQYAGCKKEPEDFKKKTHAFAYVKKDNIVIHCTTYRPNPSAIRKKKKNQKRDQH